MLEKLGVKVYSASNSCSVFEQMEKLGSENKIPDIFILDLILPGDIGGETIIHQLKKKAESAYYVVSSGYSDNFIISEYASYGFDDFLRKPYSISDIRNIIINFKNKIGDSLNKTT